MATLLQDGDSAALRSQLTKIWISSLKSTEWNKIANIYEVAGTPFGTILRNMEQDVSSIESLLCILPCSDVLIKECRKELSVNESAKNWIRGAVERAATVMRTKLEAKKNEAEARRNVSLEIPRTYVSGSLTLSATESDHLVTAQ